MTQSAVIRMDVKEHEPPVSVRLAGLHSPGQFSRQVALEDGLFLKRSGTALVGSTLASDHEANTTDSAAIANTTAESDFDVNLTIPAARVSTGDAVTLMATGIIAGVSPLPSITFRLKLDGSTVLTIGPVSLSTVGEVRWNFDFLIVFRDASTPVSTSVWTCSRYSQLEDTLLSNVKSTATVDTSAAWDIDISAQFSSADPGNATTLESLVSEYRYVNP